MKKKQEGHRNSCVPQSSKTCSSELIVNSAGNMAPALLSAKGKSENMKNTSLSSKQNMKKMDPEEVAEQQQHSQPPVDYEALKTKLTSEDSFITCLLANVPSRGVAVYDEEDIEMSQGDHEEVTQDPATTRVADPDELKKRLADKLSQFQGRKLDFSEKKLKLKLKKKLDKLQKKKLKRKNNKMRSKIAKLAQETKAASIKTETPEPAIQSRPPKPIFNSEGRMVFSKFDFGDFSATSPTTKPSTNDPKAALQRIKKAKEKLKVLESKGEVEKVKAIEERRAWEGALQRAEGLKVKDNEELLVKSIKRKEQKKKQSKKKWDERIQAQERRQEEAQKKRKANIKVRKDAKKEKKLSRLAKKGKIILT